MKITINHNGNCKINMYKNSVEIEIEDVPEPEEIMINGNPLIPRLGFGQNNT